MSDLYVGIAFNSKTKHGLNVVLSLLPLRDMQETCLLEEILDGYVDKSFIIALQNKLKDGPLKLEVLVGNEESTDPDTEETAYEEFGYVDVRCLNTRVKAIKIYADPNNESSLLYSLQLIYFANTLN